jgi:hypothetical protein
MGAKSRFLGAMRSGAGTSVAVASVGFVASASAADLDGFVKTPPVMPDLA